MTASLVTPTDWQEDEVVRILQHAGSRGASHEDFVEAGVAPAYIAVMRRMVDEDRLDVRVDFATGSARWALDSPASAGRWRAA